MPPMLPNSLNFGRPFRPPIRNKLRITCKITILLHLTKKSEEAIFNDLVIAPVPKKPYYVLYVRIYHKLQYIQYSINAIFLHSANKV